MDIFMNVIFWLNLVGTAVFGICYFYQLVYTIIAICVKKKPHKGEATLHSYAVLVSARNEENVIGQLIDNIKAQDYPQELIKIFVVADNCTDGTAEVAKERGATVYERHNTEEIGKGYAINFLLSNIDRDYGEDAFDAFFVFDADNISELNFISEMNKTFSDGYDVVAGFRNAKNYGDNWLSAGQGLWFIRDSTILNDARMKIGTCSVVAGTGFMFSNKIKKEYGGWPFHMLTEDTEFTACSAARGYRFGYCPDATFYDEQTTSFVQSWNQRIRWAKGGIQVFCGYVKKLFSGMKNGNFLSCFDLLMSIAPAYIMSVFFMVVNVVALAVTAFSPSHFISMLASAGSSIVAVYLLLLLHAALTVGKEWKRIKAGTGWKILSVILFPLYMFTYVPIAFCAFFAKAQWKPIRHTKAVNIDDMHKDSEETGSRDEAMHG